MTTPIPHNSATTKFSSRGEIRYIVQYSNLRKTKRRPFVSVALLALAALIATGCMDASETEIPETDLRLTKNSNLQKYLPITENLNIIVVSFDAMRPDVLTPYGGNPSVAPNIAEFADRSVVFENAYSVAPVTPTSFAAFFSGNLPTRVFQGWRFVAKSPLASVLSDAGYQTAAFINNVQLSPKAGFDRGFDHYDWRRNGPDEEILQSALDWLDKNHDSPFFIWIHFLAPHAPYDDVPEARQLYSTDSTGQYAQTSGSVFNPVEEHEIRRVKDLYLGEVWVADRIFESFISHLSGLDLLESSIVVLTSDHGEEFGEHGGFQHGKLFEEHLRIPLILYHPRLPRGGTTDLRIRNIDVMPTLLRLVGLRSPGRVADGRDILRLSGSEPPPVIGISMTETAKRETWISILEDSHKLILTCQPEWSVELYDIDQDPMERMNIAAEHPNLVSDLYRALRSHVDGKPCEVIKNATKGKFITTMHDEESVEALRALGYID